MIFRFETTVLPEWIDYNDHMRDSYFGLIFSLAVDAMQDEVGFDEAYRQRTGCTVYLLEEHKHFLREVRQGALVRIDTQVLDCDAKRFHLYQQMYDDDGLAAVSELMEMHVNQHPKPHSEPIPRSILQRLEQSVTLEGARADLSHRARKLALPGQQGFK
jgi:acyl-CoA thioester hydrolase